MDCSQHGPIVLAIPCPGGGLLSSRMHTLSKEWPGHETAPVRALLHLKRSMICRYRIYSLSLMVGALQAAGLSGSRCILAMSRWMYIASMSLAPSTTCCLEEMGLTALLRYVPIQLSVLDLSDFWDAGQTPRSLLLPQAAAVLE